MGKNGFLLRYAHGWLCDERDVVMVAADEDWCALEFADDEMLNDCEVIKSAMCPGLRAAATGCRASRAAKALYRSFCCRGFVLHEEETTDVESALDKMQDEHADKADLEEAPQGKY